MVENDYIEAFVIWSNKGRSEAAIRWLVDRGFRTMPMKAGLLINGSKARFEAAFDVDLAVSEPPITLSVPDALGEAVSSINIPKPRNYQTGEIQNGRHHPARGGIKLTSS